MPFEFWWRWLLIVSVLFACIGIIFAFFPENVALIPWNEALARTFYGASIDAEGARMKSFLMGPLGATIAGYYVLQGFIVWKAFREKARWAWWAILTATLLWFVVDSIQSIRHDAVFNVMMINIPVLACSGLPLMMTFGDFRDEARGKKVKSDLEL